MSRSDHDGVPVARGESNLAAQDVVWLGAPYAEGETDPARVELFASQQRAEEYVESIDEAAGSERRWVSWDEYDGRRLVETRSEESLGVVGSFRTTAPGGSETPPFEGSVLDGLLPSDSGVRRYLPGVTDPPTLDRQAVPFVLFDLVLLSDRGHLELRAGAASDGEPARYLDELATYARKTVGAATSMSDDRIARSRIEDLNDYLRVDDTTAYYGKPRYRLAKRLSEWGGEPGRYATLELWLLFQLVLRLYPEHVTWTAGYEYHDGTEH
ncbi:MAG: hypothetical protein ABEI80_09510 [Haloplanus sp.]